MTGPLRHLSLFVGALLACGAIHAQSDLPSERQAPFVPDELPALEKEKPPVHNKLNLEIEGASAFPLSRLQAGIEREIHAIEEFGLDEANAYDAAFFLESFYRKNGYSQVEVDSGIIGPSALRLKVTEGPLATIGTIRLQGNTVHPTEELNRYLLGPTRERFPRIRDITRLPFVESDIHSGADLVTRLYAADGYLNAVVEPPEISWNADKTSADINLRISEGKAYRFDKVTFSGNPVFPEATLREQIAADVDGIYTAGPPCLRGAQA